MPQKVQPTSRIGLPEAAAMTGVSTRTIRRWIAERRISAVRIGPRLIKLDPAELDRVTAPVGGAAA